MKFFPKTKKALLLRQYVGEAIDPETNEKTDLSISMSTMTPIITLANGDSVIFEWQDIVDIAIKYATEQTEPEPTNGCEGTE